MILRLYSWVIAGMLVSISVLTPASGQVITTVAGTDWVFPQTPITALNAPLGNTTLAVDGNANVYVADLSNRLVMRIAPEGTLTVVAGNGTYGYSGDGGPATSAAIGAAGSLYFGVAIDSSGNLYLADAYSFGIRKVSAGIITTVAGNGVQGFSGDGGPATGPTLWSLRGVAVDLAGNLYIADSTNRIRKVSGGIITTVAGNGTAGFSGDGSAATGAALGYVGGIAVDSAGNLYIADGNRIRKVSAGVITTVAGNGVQGFSGDGGPATSAALGSVGGIAVDSAGNLYIADTLNYRIRKVSGGIVTTVAGNGTLGFSGDGGPATSATLGSVGGIAVDSAGNLYLADGNSRVRKVSSGIITTVAGNGTFGFSGDSGPATSAVIANPGLGGGMSVDSAGNLYVTSLNRVRRISGGIITTVAGNGTIGFSGDGGPATSAQLWNPNGVAVDSAGNVYIADRYNNRVRKVSGGIITTVAGNGTQGFSGDGGPATSASLDFPNGVAVDSAGNLYIADTLNYRIRKVSGGIITTVAGNGSQGFNGDGGPATGAALGLNGPARVVVDSSGNLYITDGFYIRKVSGGIITTVAGGRTAGFSGDGGPATSAALYNPIGLAVDSAGNLYIADEFNYRIRKVAGGIITTVAGSGAGGSLGDGGPAIQASFNPLDLAIDAAANLYILDVGEAMISGSARIRKVLAQPPAIQITSQSLSFSGKSNGALAPKQSFSIVASVSGVSFSISNDAAWLRLSAARGNTPALIEVSADPTGLPSGSYSAMINVTAFYATPTSFAIPVTFLVAAGVGPALGVDKLSLSFPFPRAGSARSQTITVSNTGGGILNFTAAANDASGNWLSVQPTTSMAGPGVSATLTVTGDPAGLPAGTYTGQVTITSGAGNQTIPVTMTISDVDRAILLSQTGLSFTAVAQGGVVPPQGFAVLNIGTGVANWSVSTSTLSGGQDWLAATPPRGFTDAAGQSPSVAVSVNPARLAPGEYYGLVRVDAPGAANTPQVLTVFLQVLSADADVGAVIQPAELQFAAAAGANSPGSQDMLVYNLTPATRSFRASVVADAGLQLVILPKDATLDPQHPTRIVVQPFTSGLAAGVYNGAVTLQFSDGRVSSARVTVIVANRGAMSSSIRPSETQPVRAMDTGVCRPTQLLPALTTLGQSFAVSAGWPVALGVDVKDDCGAALEAGVVSVSFSNGDAPLLLQSLKGGRWEATWPTSNTPRTQVTLTLKAEDPSAQIRGERSVSGALASPQDAPVFEKSGVVSVAGGQPYVALAPGSVISIFGSRLAENNQQAQSVPLPTALVDTEVIMNDQKLPLYYVDQHQVNAIVPYQLNANTTHQLLVRRGLTYSPVVNVDVAPTQPAVFVTGLRQGAIYVVRGDSQFLATAGTPSRTGDAVVIYCTGLGQVSPPVAAGDAPGVQPSNVRETIRLTIGGQDAQVFFAGLTPDSVGLYQVNAIVPQGIPASDQVPVVLSVSGQISPDVTMAIE